MYIYIYVIIYIYIYIYIFDYICIDRYIHSFIYSGRVNDHILPSSEAFYSGRICDPKMTSTDEGQLANGIMLYR